MVPVAKVAFALLLGSDAVRMKQRSHHDASAEATKTWQPKLLPGKIEAIRPAFLMLDEAKKQVLVSQFGRLTKPDQWWNPLPLLGPGEISSISFSTLKSEVARGRLGAKMGNKDKFVDKKRGLIWPNKLGRAPPGYGDFITVPDGFLPPGKSDGDLFLARADGSTHKISVSKKGCFYHEVEWHDFNGDGLLDILTVRVTKFGSVFSGFRFEGEMVWMENPGKANMDKVVWKEHKICDGPDVIFKSRPGPNGGLAVFTTEFFNSEGPKLTVHMLHANGTRYANKEIDSAANGMGKPFAVDIVDLDGDGVDELLVTNHQGPDDEVLPAIFAYEVNWKDLTGRASSYKRHTLTYGPSENKVNNKGVGAPGFAHGFYPAAGMSGPKYIFAAGDGAFDVWILTPKPGERFGYDTKILDINGTTGEILQHDFDGDGIQDLLVPDNDFWGLHVITFE